MKLAIPANHPLAEAITSGHLEQWLILKEQQYGPTSRYESTFRAVVKKWELEDELLTVELESYQDFMERRAQVAGL